MISTFEHGYGVVIGIDANQIERLALPTVAKDVQAIYDVLIHPERCAYQADNVKLLKGEDSTSKNILDALYWLQEKVQADGNATAIVYYSGHGMVDRATDQYYLIPYDIRALKRVRADAIKAETLTAEISDIPAKRLLVILDCCHAAGMDAKAVDLSAIEDGADVIAAPFPLDSPEAKAIPLYAAAPGSKAVSDLLEGEGRAILNSSTGAQSSYVRRDGKMSLFTYHLIEALTGHAPHPDDATVVYVTDVMSWVTHEVKKSARNEDVEQTPVMRTSGVFPVAQLIGGKGVVIAKGDVAPNPLDLPTQPTTTVTFNQQGQSVEQQFNIGGDANIEQIGDRITMEAGSEYVADKKIVEGDEVHGDKVTGDKVEGDKISVGDISGSSNIAIGRGASASTTSGDTFSGDFRGAILNVRSTLNDVTQSIGEIPQADDEAKAKLKRLIAQLDQELHQAVTKAPEKADEADAVAEITKTLVDTASVAKPNKTMIKITGEGLKQAAANIAEVMPTVLEIATRIVTTVFAFAG